MSRPLSRLLLALTLALPAGAQDLAARVLEHLRSPRFQASQWGVHAVSLDSGKVLVDEGAGKFLVPASNAKLFTCALALRRLGPDRTIRTSVLAAARPGADGLLKGDLVFYGRGDPMLMARWRGAPGRPDALEDLAAQVAAAGVRVVEGDLVGDDRYFQTGPCGSGWEVEDRAFAYGADVSALTIHDNMADLRVYPGSGPGAPCLLYPVPGLGLLPLRNLTATGQGPGLRALWRGETLEVTGGLPLEGPPAALAVPVRNPARFAAGLLRRALERHGVAVRGATRVATARDPGAPVELAWVASPPVRELVRATLKDSVNLYAQLLLLQVGRSEKAGLAELVAFLAEAGIPQGVVLEEGSGLSRKDLVKPEAVTALLAYMSRQPEAAAFEAALPVAGLDGTLRNRLTGPATLANVRAKTGTLRYNHALAGYLTTAAGDHLAFSIILNNHVAPGAADDVDAVATLLAAGDE